MAECSLAVAIRAAVEPPIRRKFTIPRPIRGQTNPTTSARANATAALLQDGTVLIAGGDNSGVPNNTIEIFDPSSGNFTFAATLSSPRTKHAMTMLHDGRVLIVGGYDGTNPLASSDIFDPSTRNISAGPNLATARYAHSAPTF